MADASTPQTAANQNSIADNHANLAASASSSIVKVIDKLRALTQISVQSRWHQCFADLSVAEATHPDSWQRWTIAPLNDRNHIAWTKGQQVIWLGQKLTILPALQDYPLAGLTLRLALTWWAELAQVYVNGKLVQEGDLFDHSARIVLSEAAQPGEAIAVAIRLVSPGHDDGALVRSLCLYETQTAGDRVEPGFVADELAVLHRYLETLAPEQLPDLASAITQIGWSLVGDRSAFDRTVLTCRQHLQPWGDWLKQYSIHLLGHAHLDLAWLWDVRETWQAAERTFTSALNLQTDYPELIFCHSTPALYEWMEQNRPDLFDRIQQQVAAGQWEVVAGMWVEPELNLISGESLVRQVLYGQSYCQEKFGQLNPIAWLPDSFGFCWQLPQILKQGGVEYFVTQKLRWNDTTQFPHEVFWWQAPDGSRILSLMSAPIGEGIDPLKIATYASDWFTKTGIPQALWLPGVGDHGGGPTRDMLELTRRWQQSPFFPKLEFTTALQYLQHIEQQTIDPLSPPSPHPPISPPPHPIPTWHSDLYLEFHRGCYTTHADQKWYNRRSEGLLYQAELWSALATITTGAPYPKAEIERLWKQVLFNQFHDILPGSAIPQVFVDANQEWQEVQQAGTEILQRSLTAIAQQIVLPAPLAPGAIPIVVFNSLNWQRSQVVTLTLPTASNGQPLSWHPYNLEGQKLDAQFLVSEVPEGQTKEPSMGHLSFQATDIPPFGHRCFWLLPTDSKTAISCTPSIISKKSTSFILENAWLQVTIDPSTGEIAQIVDKIQQRSLLSAPGNQLQAFEDKGQYWDAWNIDPNYAQHPLPSATLQTIQWLEQGAVRFRLQVVRQLGDSIFWQEYILDADSALLKIQTQVDWRERHVLVKAAFPLNLQAESATYEIPCGAITRTTHPQTPAEQAQWEVPALHWADLSDDTYGVSLLNDCKYGYDCQPGQIRLTLLRGSTWPNPEADQGHHMFTYALYPHAGAWQAAHTVRQGYELNLPLQVKQLDSENRTEVAQPQLSPEKFFTLGANNLVIMAFKQAEDADDEWILRGYECHGATAQINCQNELNLNLITSTDLLERSIPQEKLAGTTITVHPWQIFSLRLRSPSAIFH
ncbi:MAG: alpha-mannosidase [Scytolyngbya sp. HA4215-MV1]|jgi:alpha-mannosidase|nr:alpha-mannosidase [Scytolyngbya sp. HA4215-MV1]